MSTSTYPTLFKQILAAGLAAALLSACATSPATQQQPSPTTAMPVPTPAEPVIPNVLIRNKTAKTILDGVVKYRTQKGMKVISRESTRVVLGIAVPKTSPPAEARMIYSLSPAADGLRLSAQVFQITRQDGKTLSTEITHSLRDNLEEELEMYAR